MAYNEEKHQLDQGEFTLTTDNVSRNIDDGGHWVFTGSVATWTILAPQPVNIGLTYFITNRGTGPLTINVTGGSSTLFETYAAVPSIIIPAGERRDIYFDGTYWMVRSIRLPDHINVKEFGAIGDGIVNDQPAIQAAINYIVANSGGLRTNTLYFPRGLYKIDAPLIVSKWDGAAYAFVSIQLVGEKLSSFSNGYGLTIIQATFGDTFAIGIQLGRACLIEGLAIVGTFNRPFANWKDFVTAGENFATFATAAGVRDTRYSPYAGICIDPFTNVIPPDGGYPGLGAYYQGSGTGGSAATKIDNCYVTGFTVDIIHSPNGVSQNGDTFYITNCTLEMCKVAIAYCNDQNKGGAVKNIISWNVIHTFIDNLTYGQQFGCPPNVDGVEIAGMVYRMTNIDTGLRVGMAIRNVFAESLFQIGYFRGFSGANYLDNLHINFATAVNIEIGTPKLYLEASGTTITSCVFKNYDNLFNKRMAIKATRCTFIGCQFDLPPMVIDAMEFGSSLPPTFINCTYGLNLGTIGGGNANVASNLTEIPHIALYGNIKIQISAGAPYGLYDLEYNETHYERVIVVGGPTNITINNTNQTATLTMTDPATYANKIQVGDYLFYVFGEPIILGRITSLNTGTGAMTLVEVPVGLVTGSFPNIYTCYFRKHGHPFFGDVVNGSNVISNVEAPLGYPVVGERLEGQFTGVLEPTGITSQGLGAFITAVNSGAKTVTISMPTVAPTCNRVTFACGEPKFTMRNRLDITSFPDLLLFHGMEYILETQSATGTFFVVKKYLTTRAGKVSGVPQAEYYEQIDSRVNAGIFQYLDKPTQAWVDVGAPVFDEVTVNLVPGDFFVLNTTPKVLVPGIPNTIVILFAVMYKQVYGGVAYTGGGTVSVVEETSLLEMSGAVARANNVQSTITFLTQTTAFFDDNSTNIKIPGKGLYLRSTNNFATGNSTAEIKVFYKRIPV